MKKYSIAELEKILNGSSVPIEILPDGSIKIKEKTITKQSLLENMPKKKPFHEENPRISELENNGLRMWDDGYNQYRDDMERVIEKL